MHGLSNFSLPVRPQSIENYPPAESLVFTNKAMVAVLTQFGYLALFNRSPGDGHRSADFSLTVRDLELIERSLQGELTAKDLTMIAENTTALMAVKLQKIKLEKHWGAWAHGDAFVDSEPVESSLARFKGDKSIKKLPSHDPLYKCSDDSQEQKYVHEEFDSDSEGVGELLDPRPLKISQFQDIQRSPRSAGLSKKAGLKESCYPYLKDHLASRSELGPNSVVIKSRGFSGSDILGNVSHPEPTSKLAAENRSNKRTENIDIDRGQRGYSGGLSVKLDKDLNDSQDYDKVYSKNLPLRLDSRLGGNTIIRSNEYMTTQKAITNLVSERCSKKWYQRTPNHKEELEDKLKYIQPSKQVYLVSENETKPKSLPMFGPVNGHISDETEESAPKPRKLSKFGEV